MNNYDWLRNGYDISETTLDNLPIKNALLFHVKKLGVLQTSPV